MSPKNAAEEWSAYAKRKNQSHLLRTLVQKGAWNLRSYTGNLEMNCCSPMTDENSGEIQMALNTPGTLPAVGVVQQPVLLVLFSCRWNVLGTIKYGQTEGGKNKKNRLPRINFNLSSVSWLALVLHRLPLFLARFGGNLTLRGTN